MNVKVRLKTGKDKLGNRIVWLQITELNGQPISRHAVKTVDEAAWVYENYAQLYPGFPNVESFREKIAQYLPTEESDGSIQGICGQPA